MVILGNTRFLRLLLFLVVLVRLHCLYRHFSACCIIFIVRRIMFGRRVSSTTEGSCEAAGWVLQRSQGRGQGGEGEVHWGHGGLELCVGCGVGLEALQLHGSYGFLESSLIYD